MAAVDIITVDEARAFLNLTNSTSSDELGLFVTAASQAWVAKVGPAVSQTYTEVYTGGRPAVVLRHAPVLAVTSVTENGSTLGTSSYVVDQSAGVLARIDGGCFTGTPMGLAVTYSAGFSPVPEDIKHAVKLLVKHMWETQRGGTRRTLGPDDDLQPPAGYLWPYRVLELAQPYMQPGFA